MKTITLVFITLAFSLKGFAQNEEAAIKKVLSRETTAFFKHDFKASYANWQVTPQSSGIVSSLDGNVLFLTDKDLTVANTTKELTSNAFPDTFTRSDWKFRINGSGAYVTFQQTGWKAKKIYGQSYEARYMEKVNGQWKIIAMTVVSYKK